MADAEERGLRLRNEAAERQAKAWEETARAAEKDAAALRDQLTSVRFERNLLRRERAAIWKVVREVGSGDDLGPLLDLLASLAAPLREGEGLLSEEEGDG